MLCGKEKQYWIVEDAVIGPVSLYVAGAPPHHNATELTSWHRVMEFKQPGRKESIIRSAIRYGAVASPWPNK